MAIKIDRKQVLQDFFFTELVLRYKREVSNFWIKEMYAHFLINHSIFLMNELLKVVSLDPNNNNNEQLNEMVRNINVYRRFKMKNKTTGKEHRKIRESLGIDNQEETYDLTLLMDDENRVFSMSYEFADTESDFKSFEDILLQLSEILKGLDYLYSEELFSACLDNEIIRAKIETDNTINLGTHSKASKNLFPYLECESDISFVLLHYSRLKVLELVSNSFENLEVKTDAFNLNFNHYMAKLKAIEICSIGDDLKDMSSNFSMQFIEETTKGLKPQFFRENRMLRNKIHYYILEVVDDEVINELINQQNCYISTFVNLVDKNMDLEKKQFDDFIAWAVDYIELNDISIEDFNIARDMYYDIYINDVKKDE